MSKTLSEAYWREEFDITQDDLRRLAEFIREAGQAQDLTTLARRVVRGRLRFGPDMSAAVLPGVAGGEPVRLWDPAGEWKVGDRVIVARRIGATDRFEALVGEIVSVTAGQAIMQLDGATERVTYERESQDTEKAKRWREKVREVAAQMRGASDTEDRVDGVLLEHGERIFARLLQALQSDDRFLALDGRWFVRDLTAKLTADQVRALAAALAQRGEPVATADLVPLVPPPLPEGDAGRFSVYDALLARPGRFANVGTATRPMWRIVPVPWERAVGAFFAYDPDTYEILLQPGAPVNKKQAERLQALGLYDALVEPADER
ncbi:MAG: hypothetical protein Kow00123_18460 [Anaerolineales bacterium]